MKNIIKKWLGIDVLEFRTGNLVDALEHTNNRATYAMALSLDLASKDLVEESRTQEVLNELKTKKSKKEVKKITKTNKSKK